MHNFDYVAPENLNAGVQLLNDHKGKAGLRAGGTDLIINMRVVRRQPEVVIDTDISRN